MKIEKLLRRELRNIKFPEHGEVFLINTSTAEYHVLKELLARIFKDRLAITSLPSTTRKRKNVFRPSSLENELCRELRNFLEDEERQEKGAPLMASVPEELIAEYAKKQNLKGALLAPKDEVRELLETVQSAQRQTKPAMRKSFEWLVKASESKSKDLRRSVKKSKK